MIYITITGVNHYFGIRLFRPKQVLRIIKDHDNEYDYEAIKVVSDMGIVVGYIANSVHSVARGTRSAGGIYNTFEEDAHIEVCFVTPHEVIAKLMIDTSIDSTID